MHQRIEKSLLLKQKGGKILDFLHVSNNYNSTGYLWETVPLKTEYKQI